VVYVSCDAATFARDLKEFLGSGFVLSDLRVFDLFPMTEHVELVALLDRPV
jgi:tRNA/tmRNA/rRNA uracil-C5-methylase (TrmA/RlmC/RlmD family)